MKSERASETEAVLVHGTAVALGEKAVLIRGPSGSGKSDLALRCIAAPPLGHIPHRAELVADDQVRLSPTPRGIEATAPSTIAGKIEVRGIGILEFPRRSQALLALVVDLVDAAAVPRYPLEEMSAEFFGMEVPILRLAPFEASASVKLILALNAARGVLTPP